MSTPRSIDPARALLAAAAAAVPSLLAYNVSPSPTFLNQALAIALWGAFVAVSAPRALGAARGGAPLFGALAVMVAAAGWSWAEGSLPASLALSAALLLLAAGVLVASGAAQHGRATPADAFADFAFGWAVAGVFNVAIALVQVFAPGWADGSWIAHSGIPGRAVGNLRQPNHLASLLLWSAVATIALVELRRLGRRGGALLVALIVFAVVLTASRTGLVGVLLLGAWGLADRRLSRTTRALLIAAPLVYAVGWLGMAEWSKLSQHVFGGEARLAERDISSSRFGIWADTLAMIRQQPWTGVGFGEFNFAWTLTPFPHRPIAFFDHTHDLVLQLAVELGLPLAALVLALIGVALWRAARLAFGATGDSDDERDTGIARRSAFMMVLLIGLHSLLEYPLWYSYFLLPAAWAWAFALGRPAGRADTLSLGRPAGRAAALSLGRPAGGGLSKALVAGGLALVLGAGLAVADFLSVAAIFATRDNAPPLAERIARGQHSPLFAHHADYAAATTGLPASEGLAPFERATHYLLDTRLMIAWAKALARHGELDEARYLAARLREFHNAESDEFFAACAPAGAALASASAASAASAAEPAAAARPSSASRPRGRTTGASSSGRRSGRSFRWRRCVLCGLPASHRCATIPPWTIPVP